MNWVLDFQSSIVAPFSFFEAQSLISATSSKMASEFPKKTSVSGRLLSRIKMKSKTVSTHWGCVKAGNCPRVPPLPAPRVVQQHREAADPLPTSLCRAPVGGGCRGAVGNTVCCFRDSPASCLAVPPEPS